MGQFIGIGFATHFKIGMKSNGSEMIIVGTIYFIYAEKNLALRYLL